MTNSTLDIALSYLTFYPDRYIFPLTAGAKTPPLIRDNLRQASNDFEQIERWHAKWPGCNWGLSLAKSGLICIDTDSKPGKNGAATYSLIDVISGPWPETERDSTPSGGWHDLYTLDGRRHVFKLGFAEDMDSPHYILLPGCETDVGRYTLVRDVPVVAAPEWLLDLIGPARAPREAGADPVIELDQDANIAWAVDYLSDTAPEAIEGEHGDLTTVKVAMTLRDHGLSEDKALELMAAHYNDRCRPPWDANDLAVKVRNAYAYASINAPGELTAEYDFETLVPESASETVTAAMRRAQGDNWKPPPNDDDPSPQGGKPPESVAPDADASGPDAEGCASARDLCMEWVHISGLGVFIKKDDLTTWRVREFDNQYRYVPPPHAKTGKRPTITNYLLERRPGTTIRRFFTVGYVPNGPEVLPGNAYNIYRPSDIVPAEGDTSLWRAHLEYLFPDDHDRALVLNWCAWLLQNLAKKPKHALLLQGYHQGSGKTYIAKTMEQIIGARNVTHPGQSELHSQFCGWAASAKLIVVEELRAGERREVANKLHPLITEEDITINQKNLPTYQIQNAFGMLVMTNDDSAIPIDNTDRRYMVIRTEAKPRDTAYYNRLYSTLNDPAFVAAVAWELLHRDIGDYNGQAQAPHTSAKADMVEASQSELERWMVENGSQPPLCNRVIRTHDIIDILPSYVGKGMTRMDNAVGAVLRHRFQGLRLGQHKLSTGERYTLWAINGTSIALLRSEEGAAARIYEIDRRRTAAQARTPEAGEEFEL